MKNVPEDINISVVIPVFNRDDVISRAIKSVLNQTLPPTEIIVVDDGSMDNTADIVQQFGEEVTYLYQTNAGPSIARNLGITSASGNYIAFLDSDDEWMADKLEKQVEIIRDLKADIVITNSVYFDDTGSGNTAFSRSEFSDILSKNNGKLLDCFTMLLEQNFIHLSTVLVRKSCLENADLFDETMKIAEDTDLWLRLSSNYSFGIITKTLAKRDDRPDKLSGNIQKEYMGRIYLLNKLLKRNTELDSAKRKKVSQRRDLILGRLLSLNFQANGVGSALKALLLTNFSSFFSKEFYRGFYWNQKENRNSSEKKNDG
ncbi:MAG: glycosyltransferase family 2 protein [Balneolaceae bacterium]|nr:MAG: glycosyltransferase family 2 protein [Balneolaceae bacterium]